MEILTIIAFVVNIIVLIIVIYQTWLSRKSLKAAIQTIDDTKNNRQLEMLPNFRWVIDVDVKLISWQKDLINIIQCCSTMKN